jgi:hypothetical protein
LSVTCEKPASLGKGTIKTHIKLRLIDRTGEVQNRSPLLKFVGLQLASVVVSPFHLFLIHACEYGFSRQQDWAEVGVTHNIIL